MPPAWQRRMLRDVIDIAKRQAKAIVDHGMEHYSILLVLVGGKRRPSFGVHPVNPLPWQSLNEALEEALRETEAWGYCYINEAWVADGAVFERAGVDRVSALPRDDRDEAVMLTAGLKDTEPLIWEARVEGAPVTGRRLGPWQPRALRGEIGKAGVVRTW
jgi:hypothetical protein